MDIKLKQGSTVTIKNSNGDPIVTVNESGTVAGAGTKLYKHSINVAGEASDNTQRDLYFEVVSTRNTAYTKNDVGFDFIIKKSIVSVSRVSDGEVGSNIIAFKLAIEQRDNLKIFNLYGLELEGNTVKSSEIILGQVDDYTFTDEVTPL